MRGDTKINARNKRSQAYAPFKLGMRSTDFTAGANYQMNLRQNQGVLEKIKQPEVLKELTDFDSIVYIGEHRGASEYQILAFGYIGGAIKLRAIKEDLTVITPGSQSVVTGTGTITTEQGNTKIVGVGTLFTAELTVGQTVVVDPGDGRVYTVGSITSDLEFHLDRPYEGTTIAGSALKIYENYGGSGDLSLWGTVTTRQVGTDVIVGYGGGALKWNGFGLSVLSGGVGNISMARDGSRIAYVDIENNAKFSDTTPLSGFTGGTGANAHGDYNCGIPKPTAVIEGGVGVIFFGEQDAEAHWQQPNNASDEVSSRTKIESFGYRGRGVKSERFLATTGQSIAFMNEDGVFEMNSFSGKVINLITGGKIERYWREKVDITNGFVVYDQENDLILAQVALDSPQNNVMLAFNRREKGTPPFIVSEQYLNHAGVVDGNLIGGSNSSGEITEVFKGFAVADGSVNKSRYITEWNGFGALQGEKNLQSVTGIIEAAPDSIVKMRAYFDNETTPSLEKIFTTKDLTVKSGGAAYGEYEFALGARDLIKERVVRGEKVITGMRFKTIAIEIIEESDAEFKIYDIIVEFKQANRLAKSMSLKSNLF